ncbi:hypothetical protein BDZ88DRAFT_431238 [Geranomyces variabilis]|nr:hypothetical protein BDZ88DRAFT_431238 [Geranomyces variabilis]KAJ3131576.1 hypothetical protein HDU90_008176 [Geranomyces variabilis]
MLSGLREVSHKIRTLVCLVLCCGPIMFIIGIIFVISGATDTRGDLITSYNRVVADWTASYQTEFTNSRFDAVALPLLMTNTPTSSAATLKDSDAEAKVTPYSPYVAVAENVVPRVPNGIYPLTTLDGTGNRALISLNIPPSQTTPTSKAAMNCRVQGDCTGDPSSQDYKTCMAKATCASTCSTLGGSLDASNNCQTVKYLDSVCVRVSHASGNWVAGSAISPNQGCYAENQFKLGTYVTTVPTGVLSKFEVRSAADPLIYLSYRTGGTYYFGLKQSTKLAAGIVLIVAGILVTLCVCGTIVVCLRRLAGLATGAAQGKVQQVPVQTAVVASNAMNMQGGLPYGPGVMQQQQMQQQPFTPGYPQQPQYASAPYPPQQPYPQQQPGPQYPQGQYPQPQAYAPPQQAYAAPLQQQHQQIYVQPAIPPHPQQPLPYNPDHHAGAGPSSQYQPPPQQHAHDTKGHAYQQHDPVAESFAAPPSYSASPSGPHGDQPHHQQQYPPQQMQMPSAYNPF